ncbi:MAG: hypothetical protein K0M55_04355, partial [Rhizobium sp.]|nr:hypothetical protein [Rhizobium sp.]
MTCTALAGLVPASSASSQSATAQPAAETQLQTILVKGKRLPAGSAADTPLATETTAAEIEKKQITSIDLAKDLGNTPSNICTPEYLAGEAKKLAKSHGFGCEILDYAACEKL